MGLRDMFRGKSEQSDTTTASQPALTEAERAKRQATENNDRVRPAATPQASTTATANEEAAVNTNSPVESATIAKQKLAAVAQQYNDSREALQDLLFEQQDTVQERLDQAAEKIKTTQTQIDEASQEMSGIQDQLEDAVQNASAKLVAQQKTLNDKIAANQETAKGLVANVNELSHELTVLNQRQQKLTEDEDSISAKFEAEKDPAAIVALADQYRQTIDDNKDERLKNAQVIAQVESKRQGLKDQLQSVRDTLTTDQKTVSDINDELEDVMVKIATADEEKSHRLDELSDQLASLQHDLAGAENRQDEQQAQLTEINQDIHDWLGVPVPVKGLMLDTDTEIILDMDQLSDQQVALMKRVVSLLVQRGVNRVGLYTSQFTLNLNEQIAKWTTELAVDGGVVTVHNPLYNLQHQGELGAKFQLPEEVTSDTWNESHTERTLTLPDGEWTLKVHYYDLGDRISTIDYFKGDEISESSTLTTSGQLAANRFYNADGTKDRDEYYRQNGLGVLTVHYEEDSLSQIELLSPVGMQVATFDSIDAFTKWWLANDFNSKGVLVGPLENADYRELVSMTKGMPVALVTADVAASDKLNDWAAEMTQQQYLVADYETEIKLIHRLQKPLNVSLIDPHNLPVMLGVVE